MMIFKTKEEALKHAGKPYIKDNYMVLMDYSDDMNELINDWFEAEDKEEGRIIVEEDENGEIKSAYYYKDYKLFSTEEDRIYIGEAAFIVGWHKQYLNWLIERNKRRSGSYQFVGYITKEEIINRNEILKQIARRIF